MSSKETISRLKKSIRAQGHVDEPSVRILESEIRSGEIFPFDDAKRKLLSSDDDAKS